MCAATLVLKGTLTALLQLRARMVGGEACFATKLEATNLMKFIFKPLLLAYDCVPVGIKERPHAPVGIEVRSQAWVGIKERSQATVGIKERSPLRPHNPIPGSRLCQMLTGKVAVDRLERLHRNNADNEPLFIAMVRLSWNPHLPPAGSRLLDPTCWIPPAGSYLLDPTCWAPFTGSHLLDPIYWVLFTGSRLLDPMSAAAHCCQSHH
jgi:hypothetical protein